MLSRKLKKHCRFTEKIEKLLNVVQVANNTLQPKMEMLHQNNNFVWRQNKYEKSS
jgi:hypothetical protein